jgi:nucleoside-diphosphate-sugar epimerase
MRILIAGCGDVGNILATSLLQDGHTVYGLKRDTSSLPAGVLAVQSDLLKPETLSALPADIDRLVFMPTPAKRERDSYESIFIQGWKNLWAAMQQASARVLVVSSTAVYGESRGGLVNEETVPGPAAFNGEVLLEMEQLAAMCTDNLLVARVSGIYGPGRERLIRIARSQGLEIQKQPAYYTNRIHRDDVAAALKHLLEIRNPRTLYLLSDDLPAPRFEVVSWLATAQGVPLPAGLSVESASSGKRVCNQRLHDSGFRFAYPDYKAGYSALLTQSAS